MELCTKTLTVLFIIKHGKNVFPRSSGNNSAVVLSRECKAQIMLNLEQVRKSFAVLKNNNSIECQRSELSPRNLIITDMYYLVRIYFLPITYLTLTKISDIFSHSYFFLNFFISDTL